MFDGLNIELREKTRLVAVARRLHCWDSAVESQTSPASGGSDVKTLRRTLSIIDFAFSPADCYGPHRSYDRPPPLPLHVGRPFPDPPSWLRHICAEAPATST
jgi:hypothetical protein